MRSSFLLLAYGLTFLDRYALMEEGTLKIKYTLRLIQESCHNSMLQLETS